MLDGITPLESWSGHKPYAGFMRIFGSKAIAHVKGPKRGKFDQTGEIYTMVGYSSEAKAYKLWKPGTKTVVKRRDVKFLERTSLENQNRNLNYEAPLNVIIDKEDLQSINLPVNIVNVNDEQEETFTEQDQTFDEYEETINEDENQDNELEDEESSSQDNPEREVAVVRNTKSRRGRSKILRTGKPGRPRKIQPTANNVADEIIHDPIIIDEPIIISDLTDRTDRDL